MYICLCHGVSDKKVKSLVKNGVNSVSGIQAISKAGANCGMCLCQLKQIVEESKLGVDENDTIEKVRNV